MRLSCYTFKFTIAKLDIFPRLCKKKTEKIVKNVTFSLFTCQYQELCVPLQRFFRKHNEKTRVMVN